MGKKFAEAVFGPMLGIGFLLMLVGHFLPGERIATLTGPYVDVHVINRISVVGMILSLGAFVLAAIFGSRGGGDPNL